MSTPNTPGTPGTPGTPNQYNPNGSNGQAPGPAIVVPPARKGLPRWVTPVLAIVVALGVGLFGGILIGQHTGTAASASGVRAGFGGGNFGGTGGTGSTGGSTARPGSGFAGGFTSGTVVSVSGDKMVIKTTQGTDVTVTTTPSTTVTKSSKVSLSDLKAGESVTAIGQPDSSGNVTATTVTEGGVTGRFGGFGGRGTGGGGAGGNTGTTGSN
jgi:hypothetical protein